MQIAKWSKKAKVITVLCALVVALGVLLISGAHARPQASHPLGTPEVLNLSEHPLIKDPSSGANLLTLWRTLFDVHNALATATCDSAGCEVFAPIFSEQVVCPADEGESCTFQITIESQNWLGSNDNLSNGEDGLYQFTVDGAAPAPGPVSPACKCYSWMQNRPNPTTSLIGTSYAVTANVTNTTWKQKHSIVVGIGCMEIQSDTSGCYAQAGFANLQVAVYTSKPEGLF
jgi:hypothetical protein